MGWDRLLVGGGGQVRIHVQSMQQTRGSGGMLRQEISLFY